MRKFSVAVNAFNREKEVGHTLESILTQSHTPSEIIVVDDGSTDSTSNVVRSFAPRVRLIQSHNEGPGMSRHRAVQACSHEWIATCDSDDVWCTDHLAVLDGAFSAYPTSVLACTNSTRFRDDVEDDYDHFANIGCDWWEQASAVNKGTVHFLDRDPYLHLLNANPVYVSCQAFSARAYNKIGSLPTTFSRMNSEDSDLTRRFALNGPLVADVRITVAIRKHPENFSVSNAANFVGKARILQSHLDADIVPQKWREAVDEEIRRVLLQAFRNAYWENNADLAGEALKLCGATPLGLRDRLRYFKLQLTGTRKGH